LRDIAAQTEQARAAIFWRTQVRVPLGSAEDDRRNARECLGIVDDCWAAPEANYSREGRSNARNAALAFERFHQRRFFADLICACTPVPVNVEVVTAPKNILAEKAPRIGIGNGLLHDLGKITILTANVDVTFVRADGDSSNHHAFDYGMRVMLEDQAVFACAGFTFVTVAQN